MGEGPHHQGTIRMARIKSTAVLEPAKEGGVVVKCVELPVATEGETKEEALANLKEAIEGHLGVKAERLRTQTKGERVVLVNVLDSTHDQRVRCVACLVAEAERVGPG
jgi:predicted RNase H-like HicB family nuclease